MVTWLATEAIAKQAAPYSWTLKGNTWDIDSNSTAPWGSSSDGYEVIATLGWVALGDKDAEATGTSGACVEAIGGSGSPVVCTLMDTDYNSATDASVTVLTTSLWNNGAAEEFRSSNRGDVIPSTINLDGVKEVVEAVEIDAFEDQDL